ncbi:MAG: hypothetical protein ACD_48C00316G0002 [uncultured bacterium]|nr:MAG: hypothetical protein ACD_48C00316G0002 [uncultured bacterium]
MCTLTISYTRSKICCFNTLLWTSRDPSLYHRLCIRSFSSIARPPEGKCQITILRVHSGGQKNIMTSIIFEGKIWCRIINGRISSGIAISMIIVIRDYQRMISTIDHIKTCIHNGTKQGSPYLAKTTRNLRFDFITFDNEFWQISSFNSKWT